MFNGGYVGIDCKGLDLTKGSVEQTIIGIYSDVQTAMATGKPMVAYNCIWGTAKPVTPINVFAIQFDDQVIITASTLQVLVGRNDVVTIVNMVGD